MFDRILRMTSTKVPSLIKQPSSSKVGGRPGPKKADENQKLTKKLEIQNFSVKEVAKDGDCLYRALLMKQKSCDCDDVTKDDTGELRSKLLKYIDQNEGSVTKILNESALKLVDLRNIIEKDGLFNTDEGDIVPIIAAKAMGANIHILTKQENDETHYLEMQNTPFEDDETTSPMGHKTNSGGDVYLLHIPKKGNEAEHYELLEPNEKILGELDDDFESVYRGDKNISASGSKGSESHKSLFQAKDDQLVTKPSNETTVESKKIKDTLIKITEDIVPYIENKLESIQNKVADSKSNTANVKNQASNISESSTLATASLEQLDTLLNEVKGYFDTYTKSVNHMKAKKGMSLYAKVASDKKQDVSHIKAAQEVEQAVVGDSYTTLSSKKQMAVSKNLSLINARIKLTLEGRRDNPSASSDDIKSINKMIENSKNLAGELKSPNFSFDKKGSDLIFNLVSYKPANESVLSREKVLKDKLGNNHHHTEFINKHLFKSEGTNLKLANKVQLEGALFELETIFRNYLDVTAALDKEEEKDKEPVFGASVLKKETAQYQDPSIVKGLKSVKHSIEDLIGNNIKGIKLRDGRHGVFKAMNQIHAEILMNFPEANSRPGVPVTLPSREISSQLTDEQKLDFAQDLKNPHKVKHDSKRLSMSLAEMNFAGVKGVDVIPSDKYITLSERYPNLISGNIIGNVGISKMVKTDATKVTPLDKANPEQLLGELEKINFILQDYGRNVNIIQDQSVKNRKAKDTKALKLAQKRVIDLENIVGNKSIKPFGKARRENHVGLLKAMIIMQGRMKCEIDRLKKDNVNSDRLINCCKELEKLNGAIKEPGFDVNEKGLHFALVKDGIFDYERAEPNSKIDFSKLTKKYESFLSDRLLGFKVTLDTASENDLLKAFSEMNSVFDEYNNTVQNLDVERNKKNPLIGRILNYDKNELRSSEKIQLLEDIKHDLEKSVGVPSKEGRQGMLKALNLLHAQLHETSMQRFKSLDDNDLVDNLKGKLVNPNFIYSKVQLEKDISVISQPSTKNIELQKATINEYIDANLKTIRLFSTNAKGAGVIANIWDSVDLTNISDFMQIDLENLRKEMPSEPKPKDVHAIGAKVNKLLQDGYSEMESEVKDRLNKKGDSKEKQELISMLHQFTILAKQHHETNYQLGLVSTVKAGLDEDLPRHVVERSGSAPLVGLSETSNKVGQSGASIDAGFVGVNVFLRGTKTEALSIGRANDANLFGGKRTAISGRGGVVARSTTLGVSFDNGGIVPLSAATVIGRNYTRRSGNVVLAGSPSAMLSGLHASDLHEGKKISRLGTNVADTVTGTLGNLGLKGVSEVKLKRGYNNDKTLASLLRTLTGNDKLKTVYDQGDMAPLGQLFASPNLTRAKDGNAKSVLSQIFDDPIWLSKHYSEITHRNDLTAELTAGFTTNITNSDGDTEAVGVQASSGVLNNRFIKNVLKGLGSKAALGYAHEHSKVDRVVRSPKLPHDMFSPGLNQSPRLSVDFVKNYYNKPSHAESHYALPVAKALGFESVVEYYDAMKGAFNKNEHEFAVMDEPKKDNLIKSYNEFVKNINIIDQFYVQTNTNIRKSLKDKAQSAIESLNTAYNTRLPLIEDDNIDQLQATKKIRRLSKQTTYTEGYRQFQDKAVAILTSFSASGGAMKLMASSDKANIVNEKQKNLLKDASNELLGAIDSRSMPWTKLEMVFRSPFVRQVDALPLSTSERVIKSIDLSLIDTWRNGQYEVEDLLENHGTLCDEINRNFDLRGVAGTAVNTRHADNFLLGQQSVGFGPELVKNRVESLVPSDVTDPGQTGMTIFTDYSMRLMRRPFQSVTEKNTVKEKMYQLLLPLFTYHIEIGKTAVRVKKQAYAPIDGDYSDARKFKAYRTVSGQEERSISVRTGGTIPTGGIVSVPVNIGSGEGKIENTLKSFTYGNDVGALAIIMTKLFSDLSSDNGFSLESFEKTVDNNKDKKITFLEDIDPMASNALIGDKDYDHMSAILSKFRNSAITTEKNKDNEMVLKMPEFDFETGMVKAESVPDEFKGKLHNSKGDVINLSDTEDSNDVKAKKFIDRSGFFGYLLARYDKDKIQDGYKHWNSTYKVEFPDALKIDDMLSKTVDLKSDKLLTRQQWLKSAKPEERKAFYQEDPDGKEMLKNYLKVVSVAGAINDTIFQINTYKIRHDEEQVKRLDKLWGAL